MIPSILDNDFYKFTMQQCVVKLFPKAKVKYEFINRGNHSFPPDFDKALKQEIDQMAGLQLSKEEKRYLAITCPYLDPVYLDFLEGFRYDPNEVSIVQDGNELAISITGLWYRTILWEVPIMSIICELYYTLTAIDPISDLNILQSTKAKGYKLSSLGIQFAEFGTRRRFSYHTHHEVVKTLMQAAQPNFIGTSNVHFAMLFNTKPIGTHAHEWFMFHAAKYGYKLANLIGLENWVKVYRGDLGIALSDTYTTDVFLKQFDKMFAKLFDGVRHDSGDALLFADKVIAHYTKMGIDPLSKYIIFSDSLNYDKVAVIAAYCKDKIGVSFGIGTNLTNDFGPKAMNIVIKMTQAMPQDESWTQTVKLSDEPNKNTGQVNAIRLAKENLNLL